MARLLRASDIATLTAKTFSKASGKTITNVVAADSIVTVTATAHGYSTGDWIEQTAVGGAVEAIGLFQIVRVDANSYTLNGLTAVTTYTSGGTAKKVTATKLAYDLKPGELHALLDALARRPHVRGQDSDFTAESAIGAILA